MPNGHGLHRNRLGSAFCRKEIQGVATSEAEVHQASDDPIRVPDRALAGCHAWFGFLERVYYEDLRILGQGDRVYSAR